ncbi:MAG: hypothetical protein K9I85_13915 [Saprospiraceae bacterium]|nr:hypothetical protein [Saprospiraceae bacterium]
MYRKCLHSLFTGLFLLGLGVVEAQTPANNAVSNLNAQNCSSISDIVDREICMTMVNMETISLRLADPQQSETTRNHDVSLLHMLQQKITRLNSLSPEEKALIKSRRDQYAAHIKKAQH